MVLNLAVCRRYVGSKRGMLEDRRVRGGFEWRENMNRPWQRWVQRWSIWQRWRSPLKEVSFSNLIVSVATYKLGLVNSQTIARTWGGSWTPHSHLILLDSHRRETRIGNIYKLPTANMKPTPIFFFLPIFNFQSTGSGRETMRRSWIMLIALFAYASLLTLRHVPPRMSLFQKKATGWQEKTVMKNIMVVLRAIIPIIAKAARRNDSCGKIRR